MHLEERQFEDLPESLSPTTTTRRSSQDDERPTTRPSSRTSVIAAQPTLTDTALPSPFDTNLGNNFTSPACPAFFNDFLKNSTFKSCLPISVLLRNSNSFFIATKNLVTITRTLDASCNADFRVCSALMEELGAKITDDAFCGSDFERENPMVIQAYEGFLAYQPLYQAACTRDVSGSYCFATAITNRSSISDSYPYYLPVGVAWPGGARPSCNECLKGIMRVFSDFASNKTQLIHETYQPAAQQMNIACGPEFINTTIPVKQNGSSDLHVSSSSLVTFVALLVTVFTLLL
ncbi:hypothetical protein M501DRAFT_936794 [Patellaria atrata CBS 101060]|uniref:DUF7729 domain-containing protein n=1 Tax=Patellaria atrata CBS 101060 TaxID=1346257 RepID=A0A9P4S8J3_9PEZI|nr:hypothetical protein M501DRAFT_936794 [Patellaria atrata CBS 101060]